MAKAAILFAIGAFLAVLGNVLAGSLAGLGRLAITEHTHFALPSTIFTLFAWFWLRRLGPRRRKG